MSNQSKTILYLVILILAATGGFLVGKIGRNQSVVVKDTPRFTSHPMFRSQAATIEGIVKSIQGSSITISDDKNHTETFPVAKSFTLYPENSSATPSSSLSAVEVNRRAIITLVFDTDKFYVVSVAYISTPAAQ